MARKDPSPNERYNTTDCVRGTQRKPASRANKPGAGRAAA